MRLERGETIPFPSNSVSVLVLIPVYNDWGAVALLLPLLDQALIRAGRSAAVLLIDDASSAARDPQGWPSEFAAIQRVEILTLRRNLGHQRAIAIGLAFAEAERDCEALVLMDGDGEDDPADIPRLLKRCEDERNEKIIFAERTKRSESRTFRAGYFAYRVIHYLLVGPVARIGNFSVIPRRRLRSLAAVSELWSHYAAAVVQSRQPMALVASARAKRLQGRSQMNYARLVIHGLSAVAVYSDAVGIRLLAWSCAMIAAIASGMIALAALKFTTGFAIPQGAVIALGSFAVLLCVGAMLSLSFSLLILGSRSALSFLPSRDYVHFVGGVQTLDLRPLRK